MRFFLFYLLLILSVGATAAQPQPDLGPDTAPPSADDFGTLPDTIPDEGAQVAVEEEDPEETLSRLDQLYNDLADADKAGDRDRIASGIRRIWMESGSATVDLLMMRAGRAIEADDHALALDLLDVVVVLKPSFAEGWNRRATVHYMREDFGKSLVDIERTLALEPRHWGALSGLAIIQRRLGFETEALDTFKQALEIHPGLENAEEAVKDLQKSAEGEPA